MGDIKWPKPLPLELTLPLTRHRAHIKTGTKQYHKHWQTPPAKKTSTGLRTKHAPSQEQSGTEAQFPIMPQNIHKLNTKPMRIGALGNFEPKAAKGSPRQMGQPARAAFAIPLS